MEPEIFGPYRLDGLIGRGGMGEVHRAFDTAKKRTVALKRLRRELADDADFQRRFRRVGAAMILLVGANLVLGVVAHTWR